MTPQLKAAFPQFVSKLEANADADPEEMLPGASAEEITSLEQQLGIPLPDSYKDFLQATKGFCLFGGAVQIGSQHPFFHDFPAYDSLNPQEKRMVKMKGGGWPPPSQGMLCFAEYFLEADGDQVLFDVKGGLQDGEYPVFYYSHETAPPTVKTVASSFREWLNDHCVDDMEEE